MALGTIDSVKHIERCLKLGTIEITETSYGWQVKGDTYPVKEYLKKEFDAHWNKDAQAWDIVVMDCYSDGRNHYHYTLLNDACKPAEPEPEQPEQTEPETADDETIEYAQLMEWQDEDGNAISYELDYGDEETGYESIACSGTLESVIDEIERDGLAYRPCPANGCGEVWQLYQQKIDGMEGLGARAVCCAVFER